MRVNTRLVAVVAVIYVSFPAPVTSTFFQNNNDPRESTFPLYYQYQKHLKPSWLIPLVNENYPPNMGGASPYNTNYTLTEQCFEDFQVYSNGYAAGQDFAMLMSDADGAAQSGMFHGANHWVGYYEMCIHVKATHHTFEHGFLGNRKNYTHSFDAKYCRAFWNPMVAEYSTAVCVPDSCSREDVFHMISVGDTFPVGESRPIYEVYCGERQPFGENVGAIISVVILLIFVVIIAAGTILDYVQVVKQQFASKKSSTDRNDSAVQLKTVTKTLDDGVPSGYENKAANIPEDCHPNHAAINITDVNNATPNTISGILVDGKTGSEEEDKEIQPAVNGGIPIETSHQQNGGAHIGKSHQQIGEIHSENTCQEKKPGKAERALLAFSLYRNLPRIVSTEAGGRGYLALNGTRFLAMCWIVLGHTWQLGIYVTGGPPKPPHLVAENLWDMFRLLERWQHAIINEMHISVETFFLLSSCLVTVSFMKGLDRQKGRLTWKQMILYYVHRYWRLTPVYAILLMAYANLFYYMANGPLVPEKFLDVDTCHDRWWANLLYIHNFLPDVMCMGWSWYLSLDFQFYVICPLFVFLIYRWKKIGIPFLILGYLGQLTAKSVIESYEEKDWWADIYIAPWCRFGPYAIGIGLGAIMFYTKNKVKMHWWMVVLGWLLSTILAVVAIWGGIWSDNHGWQVAWRVLQRDIFALAVAWVLFACSNGYGWIVNSFLSWSFFTPLSRLTYVGYLLHPMIMYIIYYSFMKLVYVQDIIMIMYFCGFLMLLLPLSVIVSVCFEVPMLELEKVFLPSRH